MFRKAIILAGAIVISLAAPAAAQYGPVEATVQVVTPGPVAPGELVTVTGQSYPPNTVVSIYLKLPGESGPGTLVGTVTTNVLGEFITQVRIPAGFAPGSYTLVAVGGDRTESTDVRVGSGGEVAATGTVGAAGTSTGTGSTGTGTGTGSLPRTGTSSVVPLTVVGAACVAVGGGVMLSSRRRRPSSATKA